VIAILARISDLPVEGVAIVSLLAVAMASMWVAWNLIQKMIAVTPVLEAIATAIKDTNTIHAEQIRFFQERVQERLDRHEGLLDVVSKDTAIIREHARGFSYPPGLGPKESQER
jgi:hypothetical protein